MIYYTFYIELQYYHIREERYKKIRTTLTCEPRSIIKEMNQYMKEVFKADEYEVVKLIRISDGIPQK